MHKFPNLHVLFADFHRLQISDWIMDTYQILQFDAHTHAKKLHAARSLTYLFYNHNSVIATGKYVLMARWHANIMTNSKQHGADVTV